MPKSGFGEGFAELPSEQVHHLRHVLRIGDGEEVEIFDGEGGVYAGIVEIAGAQSKVRDLVALRAQESDVPNIILGAALIKPARFEWMLEKTTELGVQEIIPLETRFSDGRVAEGAGPARMNRWRRILQQASEQCGRIRIPLLRSPLHLSDWLGRDDESPARRIFCCPEGKGWKEINTHADSVMISVGPEGGWDRKEISAAEKSGWDFLNLGMTTLRAETAAVAAVALVRLAQV